MMVEETILDAAKSNSSKFNWSLFLKQIQERKYDSSLVFQQILKLFTKFVKEPENANKLSVNLAINWFYKICLFHVEKLLQSSTNIKNISLYGRTILFFLMFAS